MKPVRESAEHHFLTTLDDLKSSPKGWVIQHYALSLKLSHAEIVKDPGQIATKISKAKADAEIFFDALMNRTLGLKIGYAYLFSDMDIVLLIYAESEEEKRAAYTLFGEMSKKLPEELSEAAPLVSGYYNAMKLADRKIISAQRFSSYDVMCDANKVGSIALRRARRDDPKVMIVEDDRFTAAYTSSILSKEYDLIVCKTGEEAIADYIEHAPDIVFLDIHLPGLSGQETLQSIRAVDPQAFVVMLSVDTAKKSIVEASKSGAHSFIKKPFSKERLVAIVKSSPFVRSHNTGGSIH